MANKIREMGSLDNIRHAFKDLNTRKSKNAVDLSRQSSK